MTPPLRRRFLPKGQNPARQGRVGALLGPSLEVSRPPAAPRFWIWTSTRLRGRERPLHPSPCRPQVLVCVRVCAPRGRESVLHHWVPLLLGARPGRSLMTSLLPLAHHLVRSPFFPPSPLIPLLGEAREPRPPQRASLVCLFPFPSAAGSDHSFVLRFSQAPSLDLFSSFLCDSGCVFGWCCDLTTSFN